MGRGVLRARTGMAVLLVACLLMSATAWGAAPGITGLSSSTHPDPATWYANGVPTFSWDPAGDLPRQLGLADTPDNAMAVAVCGDMAYVADGSSGLQVMDISVAGAPTLAGSLDTSGHANDVAIAGNMAYVADGSAGLQVVDVSMPGTPTLVGSFDTTGVARDVTVSGDVAYVADDAQGLVLFDISDPTAPTVLGARDLAQSFGVAVAGDVAYVADYGNGLRVIDVSDPSAPRLITTCDTPGQAQGVAIAGDTAYVADGSAGFQVIDVSSSTAPTLVGAHDTPSEAYRVAVAGDAAYVADGASGLQVIDVSDPEVPVPLGTCDTPGWAFGVAVAGNVAYVADAGTGLQAVEVAESDPPALFGFFDTPGYPYDVAVVGDIAYVAAVSAGLRIIDISEPGTPTALGHYVTPGSAWGVAVAGDTAYVADLAGGLQVVDVSEPGTPTLLGTCDTVSDAHGVTVSGDVVYVGDWGSGLRVVDVSDPTSPTLLGTYDTPSVAWGVAVAGDTAYVADNESGLQIIDVSEPTSPTLLGAYDTPAYALGVAVAGDTAYVADNASGLQIIDVSEPGTPTLLGAYDTPHYAYDVAISGDVAYVADGGSGLQAIDVSEPSAPTLIGSYDTSGETLAVAVAGDVAYIADGSPGLQVFDVAHGPFGYSFLLDESASTVPDAIADSATTSKSFSGQSDGEYYFHVRAVGLRGEAGDTSHRRVMIDTTAPSMDSDVVAEYIGSATIEITADDAGGSGVDSIRYQLDGGATVTSYDTTVTVQVDTLGEHGIDYWSQDNLGHWSLHTAEYFTITADATDYTAVAGTGRYETAIKTSREAFADGTADAVVIATGENWPDALGGAALAAAKNGPILLTAKNALPSGVITEIRRLGATKAFILGGTGAVSAAVEDALEAELGAADVSRISGTNRYATAEAIAAATIAELGASFDGTAFVGTGANFPDALAASPLAAAKGWPIFLSNPAGDPPTTRMDNLGVTDVLICGGTGVVSAAQESALKTTFGAPNVERIAGTDRYSTGVKLATYGVEQAGLAWDGLAMSTGTNFPDALAGGVLAAKNGSVMLLTASTSLPGSVATKLTAERDSIANVYYLGGLGAISQDVRDQVAAILH